MRSLLAILLLLSGVESGLQAQDLTGQWTGTATDNASDRRHKLVLTITQGDSAFGGVLHWYFPETQYIRHLVINGRFYGKDSILTVREDSAAEIGEPAGRPVVERDPAGGFHVLYYRRTAGHRDVLEGHWQTSGGGQMGKPANLTIRLEKKAPPFIPLPVVTPPHKKDSVQLKALFDRQNIVAATIPVHGTDTVRIELYDNGEIDGDSVSLYVNDELLLQHLKLTAQPKVLLVPIDKRLTVNKLTLFAENLGKFPPNTALMEVTVHGKTYDLFLSTDYKKNASVQFTLQE
jgi:hypothetical protein